MLNYLYIVGVGFFEILIKGSRSFTGFFIFFFLIVCIWTIYRLIGYLIFLYMKSKLEQKHLDDFVNLLGSKYFFKKLGHGDKRYRWVKWYIVVKANFDEEGNKISGKVVPFRFWHYGSVLSFI
jgi:hypothetical protein